MSPFDALQAQIAASLTTSNASRARLVFAIQAYADQAPALRRLTLRSDGQATSLELGAAGSEAAECLLVEVISWAKRVESDYGLLPSEFILDVPFAELRAGRAWQPGWKLEATGLTLGAPEQGLVPARVMAMMDLDLAHATGVALRARLLHAVEGDARTLSKGGEHVVKAFERFSSDSGIKWSEMQERAGCLTLVCFKERRVKPWPKWVASYRATRLGHPERSAERDGKLQLEEMEVELVGGHLHFRHRSGASFGAGQAQKTLAALWHAFIRANDTTRTMDGVAVRRVDSLEYGDEQTELFTGSLPGARFAFIWRRHSSDASFARVEVGVDDMARLLEWMNWLPLDPPWPYQPLDEPRGSQRSFVNKLYELEYGPLGAAARRAAAARGVLVVSEELQRRRGASRVVELVKSLESQLEQHQHAYAELLPRRMFAADPFEKSAQALGLRFESESFNRPFWDAESPARPLDTTVASFVAMTGSLQLGSHPIEDTPHLVLAGPAVPFVVPALLERPYVKAVVAEIQVGAYRGHVVAYFSQLSREPAPLPDEWGRTGSWVREFGKPLWRTRPSTLARDFDLGPWIARGKLAWHPPGNTRDLRWTAAGCPYLTLRGTRADQRFQHGKLR